MNTGLQVTSPSFEYDMSYWCREKAQFTVSALASLVDQLQMLKPETAGVDHAELWRLLSKALFGVFVKPKRAHLIIENGPTWGIKGSAVIIENEPI